MIVFQTLILQRVNGVYGARNIRDLIDSLLDLKNKGDYDKLLQDSHRRRNNLWVIIEGPKPRSHGIVIFSNLVLKGKFRKAIHFIVNRRLGRDII